MSVYVNFTWEINIVKPVKTATLKKTKNGFQDRLSLIRGQNIAGGSKL